MNEKIFYEAEQLYIEYHRSLDPSRLWGFVLENNLLLGDIKKLSSQQFSEFVRQLAFYSPPIATLVVLGSITKSFTGKPTSLSIFEPSSIIGKSAIIVKRSGSSLILKGLKFSFPPESPTHLITFKYKDSGMLGIVRSGNSLKSPLFVRSLGIKLRYLVLDDYTIHKNDILGSHESLRSLIHILERLIYQVYIGVATRLRSETESVLGHKLKNIDLWGFWGLHGVDQGNILRFLIDALIDLRNILGEIRNFTRAYSIF